MKVTIRLRMSHHNNESQCQCEVQFQGQGLDQVQGHDGIRVSTVTAKCESMFCVRLSIRMRTQVRVKWRSRSR